MLHISPPMIIKEGKGFQYAQLYLCRSHEKVQGDDSRGNALQGLKTLLCAPACRLAGCTTGA